MKTSVLALFFAVGFAAAQSVDGIPDCAKPCVLKYTTGNAIAGCKNGNVKCICENGDFLNGIACCLSDACDAAGKAAAVKYAQQICSTAGVSVPDEVTCNAASSSAATGSAASSSSASAASSASDASTASRASAAAGTSTAAAVSSTSPAAAAGLGGAGAGGAVGALLAVMMAL